MPSDINRKLATLEDEIIDCDECTTRAHCDYHDAKYEQLLIERRNNE